MNNEEYLLNRILGELEYINSNVSSVETNTDLIMRRTVEIKNQLTESGDSILLNRLQKQETGIGLIALIGMLFIIYYFVMRCLK